MTPPATAATHEATVGDFGIDRSAGKPQVDPGDDFFAYASGHWYETFDIPPDRPAYSTFHELADRARGQVREIIEGAAASQAAPAGTPEQKIGDYYASYMDVAAIEAQGLKPAEGALARIAAAKTHGDIARLFGETGFASLFGLSVMPDLKDPDRYAVFIEQSGLGLPNRDYYLGDDPKLAEVRGKYLAYIGQMLELGGIEGAPAKARDIMAFETAIARAQWPIEKQRDVEASYNPRSKAEVLAYAQGFDWQPFFEAAEIGGLGAFVVSELTAVRDLAQLFARTPLPTLEAYLGFHYLSDHAQYLPKRFDDARFDFYGRTLRNQPEQRPRWERGVDQVSGALGEQIGQLYVARHFPPESKAMMERLVANLREALRERVGQLDWMTPETKQRALEKLAAFRPKIGYPDKWKDYSKLEVRRGDPIGNSQRAQLWEWRREIGRLDEPVDRDEWFLTPQTVNAYYNPLGNEIVFPAAILQPPFFDPNADTAVNYGAIGAVIGHEIGHGFDDQGRKFGPRGNLTDWWTPQDSRAFEERAAKLVEQYSQFEALPGLKVNGRNTLGENIGDLGGLDMAYHAYHLSLGGQAAPVLEGLSGDQRFFLAFAQIFRAKYREGTLREQVLSDVHSPAYFRVNGPVRNMDAWYAAFDVQPDDALYLPPGKRVSIW